MVLLVVNTANNKTLIPLSEDFIPTSAYVSGRSVLFVRSRPCLIPTSDSLCHHNTLLALLIFTSVRNIFWQHTLLFQM